MTDRSTARASLSIAGRFMLVLALLTTLAVFALLVTTIMTVARTEVALGNEQFHRCVVLLVDGTESLDEGGPVRDGASGDLNFQAAKSTVERKVFPFLGPGDCVSAYSIGSGFSESANRIFGESGLPGAPETAGRGRRSGLPADLLMELWRDAEEIITGVWGPKLTALERQRGGFSSYLEAIGYVGERFRSLDAPSLREKVLIVIGDLYHTPPQVPFVPPPAADGERTAFGDVDVTLVYPYRAGLANANLPDIATLQAFWHRYFTERGNPSIAFRTFDDPSRLVAQNPLERPSAAE